MLQIKSFKSPTLLSIAEGAGITARRLDIDKEFFTPVLPEKEIKEGSEFPENPRPGQLFIKNGKLYIYKDNADD